MTRSGGRGAGKWRVDDSVHDQILENGTDRWASSLATAEKTKKWREICVCWREKDVLGGNWKVFLRRKREGIDISVD
jgi:hypothetical protein